MQLANKIQLKRPDKLGPLSDFKRRDGSAGSDNNSLSPSVQQSAGYLSGGLQTDTESARLSNVQSFKYNAVNRNPNASSIQKVAPPRGMSEEFRLNESTVLPELNRSQLTGTIRNPNLSTITNSGQTIEPTVQGHHRRASPESLAIMLANAKNYDNYAKWAGNSNSIPRKL